MRPFALLVVFCAAVACQTPAGPASPEREQRIGGRDQSVAGQTSSELPPRGVELPNIAPVRPAGDGGSWTGQQGVVLLGGSPAGPADGGAEAAAVAEVSRCEADADCELTRVAPGGCCASLCEGRAVTKERAGALAAAEASCSTTLGAPCPVMPCRPPRSRVTAACEAGRCVERRQKLDPD